MPKEQLRKSKTWWPGTVQIKIGTSSVTKMRHVPNLHLHLHNWHFFLPGITNITSNEHFQIDTMPLYTKEVPSANQHAKTTYTPITTTTTTNMLFHSLATL